MDSLDIHHFYFLQEKHHENMDFVLCVTAKKKTRTLVSQISHALSEPGGFQRLREKRWGTWQRKLISRAYLGHQTLTPCFLRVYYYSLNPPGPKLCTEQFSCVKNSRIEKRTKLWDIA